MRISRVVRSRQRMDLQLRTDEGEPEAGGKQLRDLWRFPVCQGAERIKGPDRRAAHPTQKPLALVRRAFSATTHPGYSVLDPFDGSGTTAAAAHKLGIRWVGIEKEDRYVQVIRERMEARGGEFLFNPQPTLMDVMTAEMVPPLNDEERQFHPKPSARRRSEFLKQ